VGGARETLFSDGLHSCVAERNDQYFPTLASVAVERTGRGFEVGTNRSTGAGAAIRRRTDYSSFPAPACCSWRVKLVDVICESFVELLIGSVVLNRRVPPTFACWRDSPFLKDED